MSCRVIRPGGSVRVVINKTKAVHLIINRVYGLNNISFSLRVIVSKGYDDIMTSTYRVLEIGNEIVPVLVLLKTGERHLGSRDVLCGMSNNSTSWQVTYLFRVLQVLEESGFVPRDALADVGSGVRETVSLASFATEYTVPRQC